MSPGSPAGNAFVFVVCGPRRFTDELHYSLRAIRSVSCSRIIAVTDSTRNEQPIEWDDIIDVATPGALNDHQASIYLKTSLHKFLNTGPCYCYLDADVVALRPEVDNVFHHKSGPVTFANDHIGLSKFSPHALYCGCLERHARDLNELESMLATTAAWSCRSPRASEQGAPANVANARSRIERLLARIPYVGALAHLEAEDFLRVPAENEIEEVQKRLARWTHDPVKDRWTSPEGHEVHTVRCNHLVEHIRQRFGIRVSDPDWRHWNGGVFVFDSSAHDFLEAWHRKTMSIFTDPLWRTRDQGTLAATVCEFGLQDARVLGKEFNFIVDYFQRSRIGITTDGSQITNDAFATATTPFLIHVLNHFSDKTWDIWEWVDRQVENHAAARNRMRGSAIERTGVMVTPGGDAP